MFGPAHTNTTHTANHINDRIESHSLNCRSLRLVSENSFQPFSPMRAMFDSSNPISLPPGVGGFGVALLGVRRCKLSHQLSPPPPPLLLASARQMAEARRRRLMPVGPLMLQAVLLAGPLSLLPQEQQQLL